MFILNILLLIFILGILIFIHELGHFLAAKKCGVHIYEFALGMGPVLFSKKGKDGVLYNLRLFPIGGFVQMAGEVLEDDNTIPKEKFMCNRPWHQRLLVLISGVVMNFILALVVLFAISLIWGHSGLEPVVGNVVKDYPMEKAGIVAGDKIVEINGYKTGTWDKAQIILNLKHKGAFKFVIEHKDGTKDTYEVTPVKEKTDDVERSVFGLSIDNSKKTGFVSSLKYAGMKFGAVIESMVLVVGNLFTGKLSLSALSGPVGIYQVVGSSAAAGIENVIFLIAFLSINLGFVNILPFPAFDGGRILFLVIEKIKGSPVKSEVENWFHMIGFILLMLLMVYITFQDILKLF